MPRSPINAAHSCRAVAAALLLLVVARAAPAQTRVITFEEAGLAPGPIASVTRDGLIVRFVTRSSIFRPTAATASSPYALRNSSQEPIGDETGFQKPMIIEFSHLQRSVQVSVGLNDRDDSRDGIQNPTPVVARLVAFDEQNNEVAAATTLGAGPVPITRVLAVSAAGDTIRRIKIEYDGNNAEVIDNLTLTSDATTPVPPDVTRPVVVIHNPAPGAVGCGSVVVNGTVTEAGSVTLTINGTPVAVRRIDANRYEFNTTVSLPAGASRIDAVATDAAGRSGSAGVSVTTTEPARFAVTGVRFTQTGLLDPALPAMPTRLVAGKTGLLQVGLQVRTVADSPSRISRADLSVEGGRATFTSPGLLFPSSDPYFRGAPESIGDGSNVYFFIDGTWLEAGYPLRFVLRAYACGRQVHEAIIAADLRFRSVPGMTMLIVPQHRPYSEDYTRGLLEALSETARMYPVADGIAALDGDAPGGVRFAVTAPVSYRDHLDPNRGFLTLAPSYDQGFLLRDHNVATESLTVANLREGVPVPFAHYAGEFLVFTGLEDANDNGVFDPEELARVMIDGRPAGPDEPSDWQRRTANFGAFMRTTANSLRQHWNLSHSGPHRARRAIVCVTEGQQNRTGWKGNAGEGEPSFWATIDAASTARQAGAAVAHELGHSLGLDHTPLTCWIPGTAVNLRTRGIYRPQSIMCSGIADPRGYFLLPREYDELFDRFVAGEETRISLRRAGPGPVFAMAAPVHPTAMTAAAEKPEAERTLSLVGSIGANGTVEVFESLLGPSDLPYTDERPGSPYTVAFVDTKGRTLAESPFAASFAASCHPRPGPMTLSRTSFAVVRPFPRGTAEVQVRRKGVPLAKLVPSSNAPKIGAVTVVAGTEEGSGLAVAWKAEDVDGDPLTYTLSYSIDNGKTYRPLCGGVRGTGCEIAAEGLAGGPGVLFKVLASDGFNTAEAISEPLWRPVSAPVAAVLRGSDGAEIDPGQPITLRGAGLDPEDGVVPDNSLRWFELTPLEEVFLGAGPELLLEGLAPGEHRIRLEVDDRDGLRGYHEIKVRVRPAAAPAGSGGGSGLEAYR